MLSSKIIENSNSINWRREFSHLKHTTWCSTLITSPHIISRNKAKANTRDSSKSSSYRFHTRLQTINLHISIRLNYSHLSCRLFYSISFIYISFHCCVLCVCDDNNLSFLMWVVLNCFFLSQVRPPVVITLHFISINNKLMKSKIYSWILFLYWFLSRILLAFKVGLYL